MADLMKLARAACGGSSAQPSQQTQPRTFSPVAATTKTTNTIKAPSADPRLRNPAFRRQVIAARDSASLADYREALILGKLVICGNCSWFTFGVDPAALGQCQKWAVEAWAFVPFFCAGFEVSKTPSAPAYVHDRDGARETTKAKSGPTFPHASRAREA